MIAGKDKTAASRYIGPSAHLKPEKDFKKQS
jgi:hypothetical protein